MINMDTAFQLGKWKPLRDRIVNFREVVIYSALVGGILVMEAVVKFRFVCHCVTTEEALRACNGTDVEHCTYHRNSLYSWAYIIAPAIALFIFTLMGNPKVWKSSTGVCYKLKWRGFAGGSCVCAIDILGSSFISSTTWIVVTFLEGDYYACATTVLPYELENSTKCTSYEALPKSQAFNEQSRRSVLIGWTLVIICITITGILFAVVRCCFSETFYKDMYQIIYSDMEETKLERAFKSKADEETKLIENAVVRLEHDDEVWTKFATAASRGKSIVGVLDLNERRRVQTKYLQCENSMMTLQEILPGTLGKSNAELTANSDFAL